MGMGFILLGGFEAVNFNFGDYEVLVVLDKVRIKKGINRLSDPIFNS